MLFAFALTTACKPKAKSDYTTVKIDDFFELKMNGSIVVADNDLKLTFTSVAEDSRCPKFTDCFQEGQVRVRFSAVIDGKSQVFEVTRKPSGTGPESAMVGKFKIQVYDVQPFPESGKKIEPTEYKVRMAIRKV